MHCRNSVRVISAWLLTTKETIFLQCILSEESFQTILLSWIPASIVINRGKNPGGMHMDLETKNIGATSVSLQERHVQTELAISKI